MIRSNRTRAEFTWELDTGLSSLVPTMIKLY